MMATRAHGLDERGMAAVMALIVVLALSLLVAAFLAVSAFEPVISQNLAEAIQAQYAADAGIEWAFDKLVDTNSWNTLLTGAADCATPVTPAGWSNVSVPNLIGVFTVSLRNDCLAGDDQITGVAVDNVTGTAINDGNGVVILTATGSFHGAQKKIQVVMRRHLPPGLSFPAAVNEPGLQSDTNVVCAEKEGPCANFQIDGRDYACSTCTPETDAPWYKSGNWSASGSASKLGIATQPGNQANLGEPPTTYVQNVENAFTSGSQNQAAQKQTSVTGKDQTSGLAAMGATNTLTPDSLQNLLSTLSSNRRRKSFNPRSPARCRSPGTWAARRRRRPSPTDAARARPSISERPAILSSSISGATSTRPRISPASASTTRCRARHPGRRGRRSQGVRQLDLARGHHRHGAERRRGIHGWEHDHD